MAVLKEHGLGTVKVVIVDDASHVREQLKRVMMLGKDIKVVGEADDGREAVRIVKQSQPDVVLMDAKMPGMDGIEATRRVKKNWPEVRVVVLTMHGELRAEALLAGADEFLAKGCSIEALLEAVSFGRSPA